MYSYSTDRLPYGAVRRIFRRIDETARRLGLNGCGDAYDPPRLNTVEQRQHADELFFAANLGSLPYSVREAAIDHCRRIVATSTSHRPGPSPRNLAASPRRTPPPVRNWQALPPVTSQLSAGELARLVAAVREGGVQ